MTGRSLLFALPLHDGSCIMPQKPQFLNAVALLALILAVGSQAGQLTAAEFQIGDRIVVSANEAKLMAGKKLVATVPKGRECKVERISGNWLLTRLEIDGNVRRGWIHRNGVTHVAIPSKPSTVPSPTKPSTEPIPKVTSPTPRMTKPSQPSKRGTKPVPVTLPVLQPARKLQGHADDVYCLAFSADGKTLVSGSADLTISIWDVETGTRLDSLKGHTQRIRCVEFSPVMQTVLASGGGQVADGELKLWNLKERKLIADLPVGDTEVISLDFSADGMTLFTAGWSRFINMWDVIATRAGGTIRGSLSEMVRHVAVSPDGKLIANNGKGSIVYLRELAKVREGTERPTDGILQILSDHKDRITSLKFSHDTRWLATGSADCSVMIWDTTEKQRIAHLEGHAGAVNCVAFSPQDQLLASGSMDVEQPLKVWEIPSGRLVAEVDSGPVYALAFSPDGKFLASTDGADVQLWTVHHSPGR